MKFFLRYVGIIMQILGVGVLAFPFFCKFESNKSLITGLLIIISGFIVHILVRRRNI